MGFRVRKSVKIAPGVRFNVSKTGVGMSAGTRGARYSVHSSGRRTTTVRSGVPGVYYQSQRGSGSRRSAGAQSAPPAAPGKQRKPGLFASKGEKTLYKAIRDNAAPSAIARIGDDSEDYRSLAYSLAGLQMLGSESDRSEVIRLLDTAFASGDDPAAHPFATKYLATELELAIATGVTVHLPINRDAVGLALGEVLQETGDVDRAIETVEQLEPTTYAAVSLAELYAQTGKYDEIVEITNGITNEDEATMLLLVFRGIALREQGHYDAAHEVFKEALRSRSRPSELRHFALSERARNFEAQGKKGMARKDLERILAEDAKYEGVRERLDELNA
jgi:tetratricopeptide (TPR) repeat protein